MYILFNRKIHIETQVCSIIAIKQSKKKKKKDKNTYVDSILLPAMKIYIIRDLNGHIEYLLTYLTGILTLIL